MPLLHLAQKQTEQMPEFNKTGWSIPLSAYLSHKKNTLTLLLNGKRLYYTWSLPLRLSLWQNTTTLLHSLARTLTALSGKHTAKHTDFTAVLWQHTLTLLHSGHSTLPAYLEDTNFILLVAPESFSSQRRHVLCVCKKRERAPARLSR